MNQVKKSDELPLFQEQAMQSRLVFDANRGGSQFLQTLELRIGWMASSAHRLEFFQRCCGDTGRGRESLAQSECSRSVDILEHLDEFREQFITDGRQLVLDPGLLLGKLIVEPHQWRERRSSGPRR